MTEPDEKARFEITPQPPHPVLKRFYAHVGERQTRVNQMFDAAAGQYDRMERVMSLGAGRRYRREALLQTGLASGMRMLDVGCGTGVIAAQAARIVGTRGLVVALDPSSGMLIQARARRGSAAVQGIGESLPFADESFDMLSMGYALRHVADLRRAFDEFRRVLKSDGVALILEITAPAARPAHALLKAYLKYMIPAAARVARRGREARALMSYHWETIERCVPPATIMDALRRAGFERVERRVEFGIFSAYTAAKTRVRADSSA